MENWDEAKLAEVVTQKHAESDSKMPKTDIVSFEMFSVKLTSK